jgi:hypothetical protein
LFNEGGIGVGNGGWAGTSPAPNRDIDVDINIRMEGEEGTAAYRADGMECLIEAFKALRIDIG